MFDTSPTIAELAKALSAAQGEVEGAVKGKANPAFRSKYADLAAVWDACREALTKHGLAIVQSPGPCADGRMEMTTMLAHASGEWMRGTLTILSLQGRLVRVPLSTMVMPGARLNPKTSTVSCLYSQ